MESDTSICPICSSTDFASLPDHLNAHSKLDLIQLVLQQQQITTPSPCSNVSNFDTEIETPASSKSAKYGKAQLECNDAVDVEIVATTLLSESRSDSSSENVYSAYPSYRTRLASQKKKKVIATKSNPPIINDAIHTGNPSNANRLRYDLVAVCSTTGSFSDEPDTSTSILFPTDSSTEILTPTEHEVILMQQSYAETSEASVGPDLEESTCTSEGILQDESDNATSQTSIIKYIIDQSGIEAEEKQGERGEPERWVLPDGRTIPIYSSFTQSDFPPKPGTSSGMNQPQRNSLAVVDPVLRHNPLAAPEKHTGQLQLDLMTDEEIPPRGEISEYEESNTSSFLSEDSSIRLVSFTDSRRGSPVVALDLESITTSKSKKKKKSTGEFSGVVHSKFLCYECPKVEKFKSLFELIGHKMRAHTAKKQESFAPDQNSAPSCSSSSIRVNDSIDEKFLPENLLREEPKKKKSSKKEKEFFCVYCEFTSHDKNSLAQHMSTDHYDKPTKPEIFECTTCGKTFPARTNLRKHLLVHKERKHVCASCSKGFTSNFKLMEHVRVHTKDYPYKCEVCDKSYRTPSLLNHHTKMVHSPEEDRPIKQKVEFFCGVCHKILRSKRSYVNHSQTHHVKPKKCPYCCETFIRPSVLVRHIRITHNPQFESAESKDCPICQKKLHPNSLIKHMRIHSNEKPYPCPVCGKNFRTYANLTSHSWSHTNHDRPYKCRICPKSYLFRKTLEHHMMVHKRRTLHFVCNECGVKFTNKVNMKRHLEEHYSEKKYKCKTCGKAFQRNYYLLEHERIHSGVKPFVCSICGKASTTRSNHRAHVKIHDARDAGSQEG